MSLPFAIVGALVCPLIPSAGIRFFYGVLMVVLATFLLFPSGKPDNSPDTDSGKEAIIRPPEKGQTHRYASFHIHKTITALGGFLTGLLSTGIGEVVIPQLIKKGKVPVPVSAATSVAVVIGTFLVAATTHVFYLVGHDGINAIPWNLVCYTVPGVIIGGQIGPRLHGIVAPGKMVRGIALVFGLIGIMMILTVLKAPG
ncbi:MAG: sulfite exporter TauE/SafE family protein [Bacteroidetes bacterium]|nr:MAG: sulfite exporter TauE/SafE family protein [Bacteroidota bacterium]